MTKNKKAICTPTATREEFESILRELDGAGVKWAGGQEPMVSAGLYCGRFRHLFYMIDNKPSLTYGDNQYFPNVPVLPRAEFIAAIKRDFAPKERPKMNYNKMTKAELIEELKAERGDVSFLEVEIKKRDREISELKAKWIEQDEAINNRDAALEFVGGKADEQGKKITALEKSNAEQAETIARLKIEAEFCLSANSLFKENEELLESKCDAAEKENTRIKRLAAQILCADVLEGK